MKTYYLFVLLLLSHKVWSKTIPTIEPVQFSAADSIKTDSSFQVHRGYIGMGFGIPYGVVGVNAEYCLNIKSGGSVYATAGVGHSLVDGLAYNGGLNVYLRHNNVVWRPRLSLLYGINGALETQLPPYGEPPRSIYRGVSAGVRQLFLLGKRKRIALSADVLFIVSSGLLDKLETLSDGYETRGFERVKFSFGIKGLLTK